MYYLDELYVLVLSGHQDFCICQRVWIFSEQLYPDLLIPKIQEKEYCLYIGEAVVLYCDTTPLHLSESEHKSLHAGTIDNCTTPFSPLVTVH